MNEIEINLFKPYTKSAWLGLPPKVEYFLQSKKGMHSEMATLFFTGKKTTEQIQLLKTQADWFVQLLSNLSVGNL